MMTLPNRTIEVAKRVSIDREEEHSKDWAIDQSNILSPGG